MAVVLHPVGCHDWMHTCAACNAQVEHLDTQDIRAIKLSLEPCKVDLDSDPGELVQPDAEWKTYRRLNYGLKLAHSAGVPTVYEIGEFHHHICASLHRS